jgi:hypothetical protein
VFPLVELTLAPLVDPEATAEEDEIESEFYSDLMIKRACVHARIEVLKTRSCHYNLEPSYFFTSSKTKLLSSNMNKLMRCPF